MGSHLHKGLRVIASPLLEVPTLFEMSKTRKRGHRSDTGVNNENGQNTYLQAEDLPSVNLVYNFITTSITMFKLEKHADPADKVILERAFDDLM